jgi:hypothetical protein
MLLAISTGTPAFGLDSLSVPECLPVLYVTEEDPEIEVRKRLEALCHGRGLDPFPENFYVSVGKGLSIDEPRWQASIIETVRRHGIRVVAFDPLRSVTDHADQGPAELAPVTRYLRQLMRETGCAILLCHHDTKLPMRGFDMREPPHRISGGGLFGIADTPIHVRRHGDTPFTSVLTPSHCKFFSDPPPIRYTLRVEETGYILVGDHKTAGAPEDIERKEEERILRFLTANPDSSTSAVARGIGRNKGATIERLQRLETKQEIESATSGRKKSWRVVLPSATDGSDSSVGSRTVPEPSASDGSMVPLPRRKEPRTDPGTIGQNRPTG